MPNWPLQTSRWGYFLLPSLCPALCQALGPADGQWASCISVHTLLLCPETSVLL